MARSQAVSISPAGADALVTQLAPQPMSLPQAFQATSAGLSLEPRVRSAHCARPPPAKTLEANRLKVEQLAAAIL